MRVEYPGGIYHVMSSEILREQAEGIGMRTSSSTMWIGRTSSKRWPRRLSGLAEACQKTGWRWKSGKPESGKRELGGGEHGWLQSTYTIRLNHRQELFGHVVNGRYQAPMEGKLGAHHSGEPRRASAQAKAERMIAEALSRLAWDPSALVTRRKSDPGRLAMAARLCKGTTLSIKAIAAGRHLGTSKSANARLHQWMSQSAPSAAAQSQLGI